MGVSRARDLSGRRPRSGRRPHPRPPPRYAPPVWMFAALAACVANEAGASFPSADLVRFDGATLAPGAYDPRDGAVVVEGATADGHDWALAVGEGAVIAGVPAAGEVRRYVLDGNDAGYGVMGDEQLVWLRATLSQAQQAGAPGERVDVRPAIATAGRNGSCTGAGPVSGSGAQTRTPISASIRDISRTGAITASTRRSVNRSRA